MALTPSESSSIECPRYCSLRNRHPAPPEKDTMLSCRRVRRPLSDGSGCTSSFPPSAPFLPEHLPTRHRSREDRHRVSGGPMLHLLPRPASFAAASPACGRPAARPARGHGARVRRGCGALLVLGVRGGRGGGGAGGVRQADAGERGDGPVDDARPSRGRRAPGRRSYTVCADTTDDNACDTSWVNVGNVTSVTWPGPELEHSTTYYWQVRALQRERVHGGRQPDVVAFHHHGGRAGGVRQDGAGERGGGAVDESDADVGRERAGHELRVLHRHDERQRLRRGVGRARGRNASVALSGLAGAPRTTGTCGR